MGSCTSAARPANSAGPDRYFSCLDNSLAIRAAVSCSGFLAAARTASDSLDSINSRKH